jgi:hypothetical protein
MAATASAQHAGYATIVFIDAKGKELKREFLWFSPSRRDLGAAARRRGRAVHAEHAGDRGLGAP